MPDIPIDNVKILVNFVAFKNDEQISKKIADSERKIEVLTELVAQYQLNVLKFTKFMIKKQIIEVLKSIDVKYLPYDLHSKYYLLCYAHNFKPKITILNIGDNPNGQEGNLNNNIAGQGTSSMSMTRVKQKWDAFLENAILWMYSKYVYHMFLAVLLAIIVSFPQLMLPIMLFFAV